jgi:hypothetical protein
VCKCNLQTNIGVLNICKEASCNHGRCRQDCKLRCSFPSIHVQTPSIPKPKCCCVLGNCIVTLLHLRSLHHERRTIKMEAYYMGFAWLAPSPSCHHNLPLPGSCPSALCYPQHIPYGQARRVHGPAPSITPHLFKVLSMTHWKTKGHNMSNKSKNALSSA